MGRNVCGSDLCLASLPLAYNPKQTLAVHKKKKKNNKEE